MPPSQVFISTFDDPFVNLTLEACLMNLWQPGYRWLFLWHNRPCIVIGRFQNPWLECRMDMLTQRKIPLVRRFSGGGCVYHDQGNLCFSFFNAQWNQSKKENLDFIITSVKKLGVPLFCNERHDLIYSTPDGFRYKVSGSAFKQKKDRAVHHGTLLIQSDLNALRTLLSPLSQSITSKALPSTPSPVANLSDVNKDITLSKVRNELTHNFSHHIQYLTKDFLQQHQELYQKEYEKISDWQWRYGETPAFTQIVAQDFPGGNIRLKLEVCKGVIKNVHPIGHVPTPYARNIKNTFTQKKYWPMRNAVEQTSPG